MDDKEIRLKCLELTISNHGIYGIQAQLVTAEKFYDFIQQKSDTKIEAAVEKLVE